MANTDVQEGKDGGNLYLFMSTKIPLAEASLMIDLGLLLNWVDSQLREHVNLKNFYFKVQIEEFIFIWT